MNHHPKNIKPLGGSSLFLLVHLLSSQQQEKYWTRQCTLYSTVLIVNHLKLTISYTSDGNNYEALPIFKSW